MLEAMTTVAPPPTSTPPASTPATRRSTPRTLLTAPFRQQTWRASAYLVLRIPSATLVLVLVPALAVSAGLSLTVVGIPLVAAILLAARGFGGIQRAVTRRVLRVSLGDPAPFRPRPGVLGWCGSALGDLVGWRAVAYVVASFPVVVAGGYAVVVWIGIAVGALLYPVWWYRGHGTESLSVGRLTVDSAHSVATFALIGLVALWLAPWLVRGIVAFDVVLQRWLLSGTAADRRVASLRAARADLVEDAAATLRRVERDLHDGTQAQLVAVAMTLDRARGRLAAGDAEGAGALLDGAHSAAKEALTDLRDVVRRIHPPVLDQGLEPALRTLAARCAVPVRLAVDVAVRPEPGVETIAYFCVAELLTNVVRHSGARGAEVSVRGDARGDLAIEVRDDGRGGAVIVAASNGADGNGRGTGLAGLRHRVHAVDGRFELDSPTGGPTVVRVQVPSAVDP